MTVRILHAWFPQVEDCSIDGVGHLLHMQRPPSRWRVAWTGSSLATQWTAGMTSMSVSESTANQQWTYDPEKQVPQTALGSRSGR